MIERGRRGRVLSGSGNAEGACVKKKKKNYQVVEIKRFACRFYKVRDGAQMEQISPNYFKHILWRCPIKECEFCFLTSADSMYACWFWIFSFWIFEEKFFYVALASLDLTMLPRLALNSWQSSYRSFQNAGIVGTYWAGHLLLFFFLILMQKPYCFLSLFEALEVIWAFPEQRIGISVQVI